VETKVEKARVAKAERRREERGRRKEVRSERAEKGEKEKEKLKKERTIKVKKMVEEWKIWDKEKKAAKSEEKTNFLVSQRFYK